MRRLNKCRFNTQLDNNTSLILANCIVYCGSYLYISLIFFYETEYTRITLIRIFILFCIIIVTAVFTILPDNQTEWEAVEAPDTIPPTNFLFFL